MKFPIVLVGLCVCAANLPAENAQERMKTATQVFSEIMATPDKAIPMDLLQKSECVVIVPGLKKAAFLVGGEFGKGFVECRRTKGLGWGAPAAIRVEGGSFGLQLGGSSTDLIMLIMNQHGMEELTKSKFTLGGDASVAAGPVGRTTSAQTDAYMTAEILAWSRTKGLFAGISLNGATLRPDEDSNQELYGKKMTTGEIVMVDTMTAPAYASGLISQLNRLSHQRSGGTADRMK